MLVNKPAFSSRFCNRGLFLSRTTQCNLTSVFSKPAYSPLRRSAGVPGASFFPLPVTLDLAEAGCSVGVSFFKFFYSGLSGKLGNLYFTC